MREPRERRSLAYVDLEAARAALEGAGVPSGQLAQRIVALARAQGRVLSCIVYGDVDGEEAKELKRAGADPRPTSEDGEGSAPESIALVLDAAQALATGPEVDAVVLLTDDAQLAELVRRLRRAGRTVITVVPQSFLESEPAKSADRALAVEQLLAGEVEQEPLLVDGPVRAMPVREAPVRAPRPASPPLDLNAYDWTRLVLLMRDLEAKMPFVGMRWLKNKVIGPHNVGAASIADKQALLNRAVDEGLLETYRVGNRDEGGDPVTACRLLRENERVKAILADNPAPIPELDPAPDKETA